MKEILYEVRDRVGYITINRPEKRNAVTEEMSRELFRVLTDVRNNPEVWACLIAGSGKDFSTGHDLSSGIEADVLPGKVVEDLYVDLMTIWKPTVAAVQGYCLAMGVGIALSCDIRIAADSARFGWPQVRLGFPTSTGPCILARILPHHIAMQYLFTGDYISAQEALRLDLINIVVPPEKLFEEAENFVRNKILVNAPLAMRVLKEVAVRGRNMTIPDQFSFARALRAKVTPTRDAVEGMTAFREKRAPKYEGR